MRKTLLTLSLCVAALCCLDSCSEHSTALKDEIDDLPRSGSFSWASTSVIYDKVSEKKPVSVMVVVSSSCGWSKLLLSKTLRDSTVMGMFGQWFNPCIIDGDSDSMIVVGDSLISCYDATREVFHVWTYPTTIFFNYNATKSEAHPGYCDPDLYVRVLYREYNSLKDR